MSERRQDGETRDRIGEIQKEYRDLAERNRTLVEEIGKDTRRFIKIAKRLLAGLCVIQLGLGGFAVLQLGENQHTASQAKRLAQNIQDARLEAVRANCDAQNNRHDATIARLNQLIDRLPVPERTQAHASEAFTIALIDALVPHRDCDALVRAAQLNRR